MAKPAVASAISEIEDAPKRISLDPDVLIGGRDSHSFSEIRIKLRAWLFSDVMDDLYR
jgi:hypothetical protein